MTSAPRAIVVRLNMSRPITPIRTVGTVKVHRRLGGLHLTGQSCTAAMLIIVTEERLLPKTVHPLPTPGAFFEARYPFVRATFDAFDGEAVVPMSTWRPGTRAIVTGPEDADMFADAEGAIILSVVGVYKPGKFPTRVFFTRRWRDPEGREFGKGNCRITTVANFYALTRGYRHGYQMAAPSLQQAS